MNAITRHRSREGTPPPTPIRDGDPIVHAPTNAVTNRHSREGGNPVPHDPVNAKRLLELYDRIIESPDAISRLRRFVLDLAVRGKLVEQNLDDEPASELQERITAEKNRLAKEGKIRRIQNPVTLEKNDLPFPLPDSWSWSQIAQLGFVSPRNHTDDDCQASFVPMPMIASEYGVAHGHEPREWGDIKKGYTHFANGDVGLAKITPCFENGKSTVFRNLLGGIGAGTTELHIVRPLLVNPNYILLFLKSPYFIETGINKMTGTAGQKRVPKNYFLNSPFPLPPLAEQHRIVAKVDELMALCDRLEETRNTRETTRQKLTAASLTRLTAPDTDKQAFQTHSRFALDNLPTLTTRPDQIKTLRQTILDLAIRGKLTAVEAGDGDAAALLSELSREREAFIKAKRFKSTETSNVANGEAPFAIPEHWRWTRLGRIGEWGSGSTPTRSDSDLYGGGITWLKSGELRDNQLLVGSEETVTKTAIRSGSFRLNQPGDVLVAMYGATIGKLAILAEDAVTNQAVCGCTPHSGVYNRYLFYFLLSWRRHLQTSSEGGAQPNISKAKIVATPFPLAPLAEQRRIVAKLDELMAFCDQLEASLTNAEKTHSRLLESMLHEALQPAIEEQEAA